MTVRRAQLVSIDATQARENLIEKRNLLVEQHLHLVPPIAARVYRTLPLSLSIDLEDLQSEGVFGLMRAAGHYRGREFADASFATYARPFIHGAIVESFRRTKYSQYACLPLDESCETPSPCRSIELQIDGRQIKKRMAAMGLTDLQQAVVEAYYSPAMPSLRKVAELLNEPDWKVVVAHVEALEILRRELKAA